MNQATTSWHRRLPLEGACNVRDLGGYPAAGGRETRRGMIFRADGLHRLSAADQAYLLGQGLGKVIDLRHAGEVQRLPNVFAGSAVLGYYNISLVNPAVTASSDIRTLGDLYVGMLKTAQPQLLQVFALLAEAAQEKVLFHCAAGKDRTGVTAALLLDLAGVPHEVIVEDYALTGECIAPILAELRLDKPEAVPAEAYERFLGADPENMRQMLDFLTAEYGGAEAYLSAIGLGGPEIARLKHKILEE
ncbi:tyrosine-protein phosphatase [Paenibacillus tepidiphilus]|uniref:tyrosine-protein phosphatase n=1 Tax=Paenibacillus tepidiphilus TaxID=2608683 RepID=UPI0012390312|nr:tyrosine-protein phosphatase [Paenibacillus tepidiphilus]